MSFEKILDKYKTIFEDIQGLELHDDPVCRHDLICRIKYRSVIRNTTVRTDISRGVNLRYFLHDVIISAVANPPQAEAEAKPMTLARRRQHFLRLATKELASPDDRHDSICRVKSHSRVR